MKLLDKISRKMAGKASVAVKTEVKKTALDLLPKLLGLAAMAAGIMIFKDNVMDPPKISDRHPSVSNTSITTNNYFFGDIDSETIQKILEGK